MAQRMNKRMNHEPALRGNGPGKSERRELYSTKQVAEILGLPEWRVKNFSEGIANQLVEFGFTPESVGEAVREVPESTFAPYRAHLEAHEPETGGKLKSKETPLLVKLGGAWRVVMADKIESEWSKTIAHGGSSRALFALNVANACDSIFAALYRYWTA
ncbi:MAG: hypothetical protein DMG85_05270 [Acidobacteria bacterium]|nr:MAG: hypothetical protein DMG85_05270 [Acidobacteriota bacterium]